MNTILKTLQISLIRKAIRDMIASSGFLIGFRYDTYLKIIFYYKILYCFPVSGIQTALRVSIRVFFFLQILLFSFPFGPLEKHVIKCALNKKKNKLISIMVFFY